MRKMVSEKTPVAPERVEVFICDQPFWADSAHMAVAMLPIETATRGMKKEEFSEFAARFKLRIEVWMSGDPNDGNRQLLCEHGKVLGSWCPEEPRPPRKRRTSRQEKSESSREKVSKKPARRPVRKSLR